jgi:hypothetical protein
VAGRLTQIRERSAISHKERRMESRSPSALSTQQLVLAVDLLWDNAPDDRFSPGTCETAQVSTMTWQLKEGDQMVGQSEGIDSHVIPCEDGFNFVDVGPGHYELSVQGFDADDKQVWSSDCTGLDLERFDLLYSCKVLQPVAQ